MGCWRLLPLVVLLAVLVGVSGNFDDFSLEDALGPTQKPLPSTKPPSKDLDDFSLEHALQPGDIDDSDLAGGNLPKGGGDGSGRNERKDPTPNSGEQSEGSQGTIAGIVSAVLATVIGAVSSFIAYQKKKLCFKQTDEENVNMDSHRGAQSEPPVQRTLLEN